MMGPLASNKCKGDESNQKNNNSDAIMLNNTLPLGALKILAELIKADCRFKTGRIVHDGWNENLAGMYKDLELFKARISDGESEVQADKDYVAEREKQARADAVASGVSPELLEAYHAFCESLCPQGTRRQSGFSIICDRPHNGSYLQYNPELRFFKACLLEDQEDWEQNKAISFPNTEQRTGAEVRSEDQDADMDNGGLEIGAEHQDIPEDEELASGLLEALFSTRVTTSEGDGLGMPRE
jgi:hypothetical protein